MSGWFIIFPKSFKQFLNFDQFLKLFLVEALDFKEGKADVCILTFSFLYIFQLSIEIWIFAV
jgi:hypothetical protein